MMMMRSFHKIKPVPQNEERLPEQHGSTYFPSNLKLTSASIRIATEAYLLTAIVSLTPIGGTVLPTTAAICLTCFINSSN